MALLYQLDLSYLENHLASLQKRSQTFSRLRNGDTLEETLYFPPIFDLERLVEQLEIEIGVTRHRLDILKSIITFSEQRITALGISDDIELNAVANLSGFDGNIRYIRLDSYIAQSGGMKKELLFDLMQFSKDYNALSQTTIELLKHLVYEALQDLFEG